MIAALHSVNNIKIQVTHICTQSAVYIEVCAQHKNLSYPYAHNALPALRTDYMHISTIQMYVTKTVLCVCAACGCVRVCVM